MLSDNSYPCDVLMPSVLNDVFDAPSERTRDSVASHGMMLPIQKDSVPTDLWEAFRKPEN
jgi:hypothetical protein